ncbi:MAG: 6,7-dimethyl-8-ribityllumazine synthase [Roseibacillus sp.]|jgi:6,7-dimethyl-8-ribityllumazine synthase|nr:6,7-dimethyl-8-ribityllumazine synthase [Roseibacillus sp.]|tara:strand:- start:23628 stop:24137 length:510 start_codon:yes stop_codon:yes gene_type:complete
MSQALPRKPRILQTKTGKLAIVASKYNETYSDSLVENVISELSEYLPETRVDLVRVPGAFEIPVTIKALLELERPICVIALGVIIKGETSHADLVARNVTDALQQLALEYRTPVIHEVLLVEDEAQAHMRCIGDKINRGTEAARTAAAMVDVFSELDSKGSLRFQTKNA